MAVCTVSLTNVGLAKSKALWFEAKPNQVVSSNAVPTGVIYAQASGTTYRAALVQGARYFVYSRKFGFWAREILVPATSTANLRDLLEGVARG